MFRNLWKWLSSMFRARPERARTGRFEIILDEARSEVAALIDRYRRTKRGA
jgi:hypothetical protein